MWLKVLTFRKSDKDVIVTVFGCFSCLNPFYSLFLSLLHNYAVKQKFSFSSCHKFSSAALPWHHFLSICLDVQADKGTAERWTGTHQWYYSKDLQRYSINCDFIQLIRVQLKHFYEAAAVYIRAKRGCWYMKTILEDEMISIHKYWR